MAERVERIRARQITKANPEAVEAMLANATSPDSATGTPEQVVEQLTRMRDLGCEYAILTSPRRPTTVRASNCSSARSSPR